VTRLFVNVDVPDVARAEAFYCAALGLTVARRLGPDVTELAGAGVPIFLLAKAAGTAPHAGPAAPRDYARHWSPIHLDLVVDAVEPALARALAAGARLEAGVQSYDWGRMAVLADPFGHGFCIVELHGHGYAALAEPPRG
jgi:catechol 2,3-dioxygenase-like lactoylglutathione lyase family enzyme